MNERIRELVQEAIDYADKTHTYTPEEGFNIQEWDKIRLEKFAQLVVAECVNVLDPDGEYTAKYKHSHTPGPDGLRTVLSQEHYFQMMAANKLKKHFGVESDVDENLRNRSTYFGNDI